MKHYFLIVLLVLAGIKASYSQPLLSIGGKVGLSSAGINSNEYGKKPVNGPLAGLVAEFSFTKLFSLQLEAGYTLKGGGYGFTYNKEQYYDYLKFKVIEIPLLAKFTIGEPRVKFIGFLGPYVGYTLSVERNYQDPDLGITENTKYDNFYTYDEDGIKPNRIDVGLAIGTGFSVDIGNGRLFVDGRYTSGFGKWFELSTVDYSNKWLKDFSHRVVSINLGYTMPIWSKK
jgi:hypothetical protein